MMVPIPREASTIMPRRAIRPEELDGMLDVMLD